LPFALAYLSTNQERNFSASKSVGVQSSIDFDVDLLKGNDQGVTIHILSKNGVPFDAELYITDKDANTARNQMQTDNDYYGTIELTHADIENAVSVMLVIKLSGTVQPNELIVTLVEPMGVNY
jgi:hypothetical protein